MQYFPKSRFTRASLGSRDRNAKTRMPALAARDRVLPCAKWLVSGYLAGQKARQQPRLDLEHSPIAD